MPKTQGQRGKKGATGTKGAVGKTGPSGMKGRAGAQGLKGATGTKGATGSPGARGREGRSAVRTPQLVLSGLYNQIEGIYQELGIQMKRMGQLQAELNDVRTKVQLLLPNRSDSLPRLKIGLSTPVEESASAEEPGSGRT